MRKTEAKCSTLSSACLNLQKTAHFALQTCYTPSKVINNNLIRRHHCNSSLSFPFSFFPFLPFSSPRPPFSLSAPHLLSAPGAGRLPFFCPSLPRCQWDDCSRSEEKIASTIINGSQDHLLHSTYPTMAITSNCVLVLIRQGSISFRLSSKMQPTSNRAVSES